MTTFVQKISKYFLVFYCQFSTIFYLFIMTKTLHRTSIVLYFIIILASIVLLGYYGQSYYQLPISERPFHPNYELFKPSGLLGHGLGIIGTLIILIGLFGYMARKRMKIFARVGVLKYWLEFHIFLCTLGTVFVLFHTTFKFGGIISVGFWSLTIVWVSGVIGRFLYLQIPHTIEGRELTLNELKQRRDTLNEELQNKYNINFAEIKTSRFSQIKLKLLSNHILKEEFSKIKGLIRKEKILTTRINNLDRVKRLFNYWHVAHLPFALIMLIIILIHVGVVLYFGYKWIF